MQMRRKDKQILEHREMEDIIREARFCRLAMTDGQTPYVVPLCFGYEDRKVYFHSAAAGRKIDLLRKNPRVCVQFDVQQQIRPAEKACDWGLGFKSVIAFGRAVFIADASARRHALNLIMAHYAEGQEEFTFSAALMKRTAVIRVDIEQMSGKKS